MAKIKARALLAAIVLSLSLPASAQSAYPSSPINLVVSLAAGNTVDVLARLYANKLSKLLGQSVVVINRPGAGGLIAAQTVATATPDGYTLLMANSGHAILGQMNKNLPFDPIKDFAGISMVADAPALIVVSPSLHVKTLREFVELAASKPGTINFGSAGIGTSTHLSGAYFAYKAGISLVHVPYKNGAEILPDMIAGRMQATFSPLAFVLPMLNDHKLEALAVASPDDIGFGVALEPHNLMYCFLGVLVGNLVGVLPGMGPLATISILLPLTFGMQPVPAILMLSGVYYGAQYGGAICSILLNLPCHPPHAVTCLDGFR
jgi:tripartite-type tricarboxylate transporter receptor subunit TctC